jgi:hypothetical protein
MEVLLVSPLNPLQVILFHIFLSMINATVIVVKRRTKNAIKDTDNFLVTVGTKA